MYVLGDGAQGNKNRPTDPPPTDELVVSVGGIVDDTTSRFQDMGNTDAASVKTENKEGITYSTARV